MNTKDLVFIIKKYPYMVAGGALFVLFFMLWLVTPDTVSQREQKIKQLRSELALMNQNEAQAKTLAQDLDALKKLTLTIESHLMDPSDTTDIFSYFIDIEQAITLEMADPVQKGIFPTPDTLAKQKSAIKPALDLAIIQYQLQTKGSLFKTLQFLDALKRGQYYTRITELTISRPKRSDSKDLESSITLNILGKQEA